jgi:tRNA (guanine37-N1)-methyltransferase
VKFSVLTIFPELFEPFSQLGLFGRAIQGGSIELDVKQLRDFAINAQGQLDDTPYGGGSGMILRPEPAARAIEACRNDHPKAKVVMFTPRGRPLTQALVAEISKEQQDSGDGLILLCCRYEGADQRIIDSYVDYEISIGDFVTMGGEVAAMAFMESVSRLAPNVLGNPDSLLQESFAAGLLEYPQYTKPREYGGAQVPEILLSGNHAEIEKWRFEKSLQDTRERRGDLYKEYLKNRGDDEIRSYYDCPINVALIHYPVLNKEGMVITSSVTNLDLHDIARSSRSFGVDSYYIVHPTKTMRKLLDKICEHWAEGYGATYNPNRKDALGTVRIVPDFDDVIHSIEEQSGKLPKIIVTSAREYPNSFSFEGMKKELAVSKDPHLIVFGTGWGLSDEFIQRADYILEPIKGATDFNHLSVRAAAAIILDRLLGI